MEQRQLSRGSLSTRGRKRRHQIGACFSFIMDDSFITIEACRRHACSFQKRDNWLVWVYWSPEWMDPFLLVLKVLHDAKTNTLGLRLDRYTHRCSVDSVLRRALRGLHTLLCVEWAEALSQPPSSFPVPFPSTHPALFREANSFVLLKQKRLRVILFKGVTSQLFLRLKMRFHSLTWALTAWYNG